MDSRTIEEEVIIVSGASGQLGGLVVDELLARGVNPERLVLVSRTPERLDRYAELGATTRFGDFTDPESLPTAYEGGDRLLLISINTMVGERDELHRHAITAAAAAGIRHIVYTSFVDAENNPSPVAEDHHRTEELLKQSGVAWTILRNQIYMEVTLPQAAEMVAAGQVVVGPDDLRAAYVARSDCAAAAAAVLTTPGHEFRTYEITGPEIIGPAETARLASAVTGVPIDVVENEARPGAGTAEPPNPSFSLVSTALAELIGRPPTTAREVLEAHREALLAGR